MEREAKSNLTIIIPYEVQTFSPLLQDIGIMINVVLDMTENRGSSRGDQKGVQLSQPLLRNICTPPVQLATTIQNI